LLVDTTPDKSAWLASERDRLQTEIDRLVASIAAGVPPDVIAPMIRDNTSAIARLEATLRIPRPPRVDLAELRAALEQRAKDWKRKLRQKPDIARVVLRKLVGPITLWDDSTRPAWVKWKTEPKTEILNGLAGENSPTPCWCVPKGIRERVEVRLPGVAA
jgi:hypothetical protein